MSDFKTTIGSSRNLKMFGECSKFDGSNTSIYLAEELVESNRCKSNPALTSFVSRPPINRPDITTTSKTDVLKEPKKQLANRFLKTDEIEEIKGCDILRSMNIVTDNTVTTIVRDTQINGEKFPIEMSPFQLMCNKEKENTDLHCPLKDVMSLPEKVDTCSPLLKTYTKFKEPETNQIGFKDTAVSKSQSISKQPIKSILKKCDSKVERKGRVTFNLNPQIRYIPNKCQSTNFRHPDSNVNGYYTSTKKAQQARNSNNISNRSNYQDVNINSRIFRPQRNFNGMARQTVDGKNNCVQESRPCYIETCHGYVNCSNNKSNYSKSSYCDTFVFKIENVPNNVRVRDLKAALAEHGVKPSYITWKGPRGFAYLHYGNSNGFNKDHVMDSLNKIRFKTNGVETFQLQTLIVTEINFLNNYQ